MCLPACDRSALRSPLHQPHTQGVRNDGKSLIGGWNGAGACWMPKLRSRSAKRVQFRPKWAPIPLGWKYRGSRGERRLLISTVVCVRVATANVRSRYFCLPQGRARRQYGRSILVIRDKRKRQELVTGPLGGRPCLVGPALTL
ncbi:hypothetical protein GQ600_6182 [Phytophthora cactorum]|nr:hypothetical protein GQ600_6182 [Phytophthora cactorum]